MDAGQSLPGNLMQGQTVEHIQRIIAVQVERVDSTLLPQRLKERHLAGVTDLKRKLARLSQLCGRILIPGKLRFSDNRWQCPDKRSLSSLFPSPCQLKLLQTVLVQINEKGSSLDWKPLTGGFNRRDLEPPLGLT